MLAGCWLPSPLQPGSFWKQGPGRTELCIPVSHDLAVPNQWDFLCAYEVTAEALSCDQPNHQLSHTPGWLESK